MGAYGQYLAGIGGVAGMDGTITVMGVVRGVEAYGVGGEKCG